MKAARMTLVIELPFFPSVFSAFDDAPPGVSAKVLPVEMNRSLEDYPMATIILQVSGAIASGVIANWIWEKFKKRPPKKISISKREIRWEKGEIASVIEETMKSEE